MKTCQACNARPAVVQFVQVTGDQRREMWLCRECALSLGMRSQVEAFQRLSQLLMQQPAMTEITDDMRAALGTTCRRCKMVFEEFVKSGLLGCPECYNEFHDLLKPVLRRLHGVTRASGEKKAETVLSDSPPVRRAESETARDSESREHLELQLNLALLEENYERAAELRDRLKKL
ncbi:MAG: UvrB/UvrC motif-containing protein [bacterium]|nr:UvrB/UvrC motif-containing protein [bacterium]